MIKRIACAALAMSFAAPAFADDWNFVLINSTHKTIHSVEFAPSGTADWQRDKIDPELKHAGDVKPGARITVNFDKDGNCIYDLRLTFSNGSVEVWDGLNVCDNSYFTIKYNAGGAPAFLAE